MNGHQIIATCRTIAEQQYEGDPVGAAQHEIELLRTKVLELSKKLESADAFQREVDVALNTGDGAYRP